MSLIRKSSGFTLIEIVLAIIVIGVLAVVIVPRAMRARVQAKYSVLQQTCVELASYGNEWATYQLESQSPESTARIKDYLDSLSNGVNGAWVADPAFNWAGNTRPIAGRGDPNNPNPNVPPTQFPPSASVMERLPPAPGLRNPFSGISVFSAPNLPGLDPVDGAIACGSQLLETRPGGEQIFYYAFVYQGTDSTAVSFASEDTFHAGQGIDTLAGLRNGVFFATAGTMGGP